MEISNKENYMENFQKRWLPQILVPTYFVFLLWYFLLHKRESFIKFFQKGFAIKVIIGSMLLACMLLWLL